MPRPAETALLPGRSSRFVDHDAALARRVGALADDEEAAASELSAAVD